MELPILNGCPRPHKCTQFGFEMKFGEETYFCHFYDSCFQWQSVIILFELSCNTPIFNYSV